MSASMTTTPIAPNIATAAPQNSDIVNASTYIFDSAEAVRVRPPKEGIVKLTSAKCKIPNFILTLMHSTDFGLWSAMNPNCV